MKSKKKKHSENQSSNKKAFGDEFIDHEFEGLIEEEDSLPELEDLEDDREFVKQVHEFEKKHKKAKLISVYKLIGEPAVNKFTKEEYNRILDLLEEHRVYIHFQNDYKLEEKFRFLQEEIFKQEIEDISNTNMHLTFIYEDFHPEIEEEQ